MRAFYIPDALKDRLPALQVLFNVLETFSNLPLGLNPKSRREFEIDLNAMKNNTTSSFSEVRKLVKKMKENKERYMWKKSWHDKLNTEAFWEKQTNETQLKRPQWQLMAPFSYYESSDIAYLAFHVLPRIKEQIRTTKKLFGTRFHKFIHHSNQQLKQYQENLAQAMLARLQVAAKEKDLKSDDVTYHFLEELSLVNDLLTRPKHIDSPKKQLGREDFLRFHQYIEKYGHAKTLRAFHSLPWQRTNALQRSPRNLRSPRWLFRGHNARYHAFHDRYHQISLLLTSIKNNDPLKTYHAITLEQNRLHSLGKTLNRFFQRSTLRLLKEKINAYKEHRQKILKNECHLLLEILNKKKFSESNINKAHALLNKLASLEKTDFPELESEIKKLSDQLEKKSKMYYDTLQSNTNLSEYELKEHLVDLLDPNTKDPQYLNKFSDLKKQVLMLPETPDNQSVKRLFNAGIEIRNIINALPDALISLFQDEIDQLPMLNQLLVDILDAHLILDDEKENLIQLLDIVCKKTTLNTELFSALNAFKNLLSEMETENDREHIFHYEKHLKQISSFSKVSENFYALSNTNTTIEEEIPNLTQPPTVGS